MRGRQVEEDPRLRPLPYLSYQNQVVDENFFSLLIFRTRHDFRSVSELNNHQQTCIRRTSNTARPKKKEHDSKSSDEESEYEDDENVATCQGCEMSFASVAGLDAHTQHCNKKVRCDVSNLKVEGKVDGNNFKQGICVDSKPQLEINDRLPSTAMTTVMVGPNIVGDKFVGAGRTQWDSMSKEDVIAYSSFQEVVKNTGELTERRKEDILAPAGHLELNVDFSKMKKAAVEASLENISDASPLLNKRAEVTGGGSWSDFISENGVSASSETPPRRKTKPGTPHEPKTPQNIANNGGAGTKVTMLVDFLSREGKPFRINLTMPRDCNMQKVLAKVRPAAAIHPIYA